MNRVVKMLLNLGILGGLSGAILSGVFNVADPMIQKNKERELQEAIFTVLPSATDYVPLEKVVGKEPLVVYAGLDGDDELVGLAFKADGNGFSGNVGLMVGLGSEYLELKGIEVLEQIETPGLGDRIRNPEFKDQFRGVKVKPKVEYIKYRKPEKPNQIQAITGATISSEAVVNNINRAVEKVVANFPKAGILEAVERAEAAPEAPGTEDAKESQDGER